MSVSKFLKYFFSIKSRIENPDKRESIQFKRLFRKLFLMMRNDGNFEGYICLNLCVHTYSKLKSEVDLEL